MWWYIEQVSAGVTSVVGAKLSDSPLQLNRQEGYDHSYFFISSFIEQHLEFHAQHLLNA